MDLADPPESVPASIAAPPTTPVGRGVSALRASVDVLVQIVVRAGNLVLGIVATAVLARGLGTAGYGEWTLILLVPSLVGYLNDLGFMQVAVRRAAAERDARWLGAMVTARAALSLPTMVISIAVVVALSHGTTMAVAGIIVAAQALLAAPAAMAAVFQLQVRNDLTVMFMTANSILWTVAVIVLVDRNAALVAFALALVAIATITIAAQSVVAARMIHVPLAGTSKLWRELARTAVPLSIGSLLILAYGKIDGLIVYAQTGATNAGLYGAAYRLLEQAEFIPLSLTVTLLPLVARAWPARPQRARVLLQISLDLLAMVALPALAFTLVASTAVMALIYGPDFTPASSTLPVLMGAYVLVCGGYAMGVYTVVLELQRLFVLCALVGLVCNVIGNLIFVPRYGYIAAAWVTVATEAVVLALIGRAVLARLEMRVQVGRLARTTVASAVAGLSAWVAQRLGAGVIVMLAVTATVQIAGLLLLRALRPSEIRALIQSGDPEAARA